MKKGLQLLVGVSLMAGLWLGQASPETSALSCAEPRKITEELKVSDIVFRGTLVSYDENSDFMKSTYTFSVSEWWKGDLEEGTITLHPTGWDTFEEGKEYIVFANAGKEKVKARLCGNTGPSSSVDTSSLGEGKQPEASEQPERAASGAGFGDILGSVIEIIRFLCSKY